MITLNKSYIKTTAATNVVGFSNYFKYFIHVAQPSYTGYASLFGG